MRWPSRYFEGNVQPKHHSNVENFYRQMYLETMITVANCTVECFHEKDYTMYANGEQVLLKGTLGELVPQNLDQLCEFYTEFDSDTLRILLSNWQTQITVSGKVKGVGYRIHNVVDFLLISSKRAKRSGTSYQMLCPWSPLFWLCQL